MSAYHFALIEVYTSHARSKRDSVESAAIFSHFHACILTNSRAIVLIYTPLTMKHMHGIDFTSAARSGLQQ